MKCSESNVSSGLAAMPGAVVCAAILMSLLAASLPAAEPARDAAPNANVHVLIAVGAPGTPVYARHYADWAKRFEAYFARVSPRAKVATVAGESATSAGIRQKLADAASAAQPADQFVLVLIGHGGAEGAFVVPGPDLTVKELSDGLGAIKSGAQIVLNFSSSSGTAIPALRRPGRVLITATSPNQTSDTDFAEFFLLALEAGAGQPKSLLDVFNSASHEYAQWITRQRQTEEGWTVEGKKSLAIFKKLYGGNDVPPSRRLAPSGSDGNKEDQVLPLVPDNKPEFWLGRRLVSEHALLEDTGQSEGAAAVGADGHHPIDPKKEGDVGLVAKQTTLGRGK